MAEHAVRERGRLHRGLRRLPMVLWLTVVWLMLWGRFDAGTVFFGLVVGVLITAVFPQPLIRTNIVVRPLRIAVLAGYLAWDLVSSTLRVTWQAVRYGPRTRAGIVAVALLTDSDHIIAMTSNAVSLAPGTFVIQIDRAHRMCFVYQLGMRPEEADAVRRRTLWLEERVVRAVGSRTEIAALDAREGS